MLQIKLTSTLISTTQSLVIQTTTEPMVHVMLKLLYIDLDQTMGCMVLVSLIMQAHKKHSMIVAPKLQQAVEVETLLL
jgi:hypothetical protein